MGISIATLSLVFGFICYAGAWMCPTAWKVVYVRPGERAELDFQADISSSGTLVTYQIKSSSGFNHLTVSYFNNQVFGGIFLNNCTLIGSGESGNLTISIAMSTEAFVYRLEKVALGISSTVRCITVYKLGVPSKPVLLKDRDPTIGESVIMTCSSFSTTIPSNHSLNLQYSWKVDDVDNPRDSRYAYSTSRNTLTLTSVVKEDSNKRFICSAFENIGRGYTSESSNQIILAVLYGPENVRFNSSDSNNEENTALPAIMCEADCYPLCTFTWAKVEGGVTVSNTAILQLGILSRAKAGTYRCIVSRSESSLSATKDLTVKALYAPQVSLRLSPSTIYQNQEVKMFCEVTEGVPASYSYKAFVQTYSGIIVQNDKLRVLGTPENSSLHILSAQMRYTGTYTCNVGNGVKHLGVLDQTASVTIRVKVSPTFLRTKLMFYGLPGKTVSISIPVYSYPDLHNFTILRYDGLKITNSDKYVIKYETSTIETNFYSSRVLLNGTSITLMINNVSEIDFGKYLISVFNEVGSSSSEMRLLAKGPPLPPTNFKVSVFPGVLIFSWNNSVNGGDNQSFLIQTSQEGTSNWENQTLVQESDPHYLLSDGHHYANVSALLDGVYKCRIIAFNSKGNAEAVFLEKSIIIKKPLKGEPDEIAAGNIALIVGLVLGIVVIGLLVCVTLLLLKLWRLKQIKGPPKQITSEMRQKYANVAYKEGSIVLDVPKAESSRRGVTTPTRVDEQYSELDDRLRDDSKAYDVISSQQ